MDVANIAFGAVANALPGGKFSEALLNTTFTIGGNLVSDPVSETRLNARRP